MTGPAFYERAVELHPYLRRRFVFCSAMPPPLSLMTNPVVRFYFKPLELSDLWATLNEMLRDQQP